MLQVRLRNAGHPDPNSPLALDLLDHLRHCYGVGHRGSICHAIAMHSNTVDDGTQ